MSADYVDIPMGGSEETVIVGEVTLTGDGGVVLGEGYFPRFMNITDHSFSGFSANRGDDGVLIVNTPVGEVFRYVYRPPLGQWYKRVPKAHGVELGPWQGEFRDARNRNGLAGAVVYCGGSMLVDFLIKAYLAVMIGSGVFGVVALTLRLLGYDIAHVFAP